MKKLHYMLVSAIENRFHELLALGSHCFHILQFVKHKSQFELIVKGVHVCTMQFALLKILLRPSQHWSWSLDILKIQVLIKVENKWIKWQKKSNQYSLARGPARGGGGSHVARLNFKTSRVGVYKWSSLIVGFAVTVAIWPRDVDSLVMISFYVLSLLFGPCRLSEFTLAGPLALAHVNGYHVQPR